MVNFMSKKEEKIVHSIYAPYGLFLISFESPFYPGMGRSEKGIDLTIQRDPKGLPTYFSSGLKGALRSFYHLNYNEEEVNTLFGSEDQVSNIIFSDAHLLLFPVKSLTGFFAYVTSEYVLNRFCRVLQKMGTLVTPPKIEGNALTLTDRLFTKRNEENRVFLMDGTIDVPVKKAQNGDKNKLESIVKEITSVMRKTPSYAYLQRTIKDRFLIVSDEDFSKITRQGTEKVTRIKLKYETKTTEEGGLFTQELIPEDTILYSGVYISKTTEEGLIALRKFENLFKSGFLVLQLGGDETLGRGMGRIFLRKREESE